MTDRNRVQAAVPPMSPPSLIKSNWVRNKRKILVVDDEKFNCDIVYGFLMILGVKNRAELTEFAYNGEEALSRV